MLPAEGLGVSPDAHLTKSQHPESGKTRQNLTAFQKRPEPQLLILHFNYKHSPPQAASTSPAARAIIASQRTGPPQLHPCLDRLCLPEG
jgi:hypothetical protein